jgi:hypothetical protein
MNLFILDHNPVVAAQYNCDGHIRKIILEAVEMMGYAYPRNRFEPWLWVHTKGRHINHPMSKWVRRSKQNFDWTLQHAYALCDEYVYRFDKLHQHKCRSYLDWIANNLPLSELQDFGQTDWPRCFGTYKDLIEVSEDAVYDYRRYYMMGKRHLAVWTKRGEPFWWK